MNQLCIAKKVKLNNVEFLDFATDDQGKLMVFSKFKEASDFLKSEVGTGEQLLDFLVTPLDAHKDNPSMQSIIDGPGVNYMGGSPLNAIGPSEAPLEVTEMPQSEDTTEVEVFFALDCTDVKIHNNDSLVELSTGKQYVPVLGFLDLQTQQFVKMDKWVLKTSIVDHIHIE